MKQKLGFYIVLPLSAVECAVHGHWSTQCQLCSGESPARGHWAEPLPVGARATHCISLFIAIHPGLRETFTCCLLGHWLHFTTPHTARTFINLVFLGFVFLFFSPSFYVINTRFSDSWKTNSKFPKWHRGFPKLERVDWENSFAPHIWLWWL